MSSWYHSSFRRPLICFSRIFHSILNRIVFYNDFPIGTYIVLLNPCMHQILKSVTESFKLEIHNIMSGRGCRGRSRTSTP